MTAPSRPRQRLEAARGRERGMVTVELAIGFITATFLAAALSSVVLLGVGQAAASRASTEVARQLARGDQVAADAARDEAPTGTTVDSSAEADGIRVRASVPVDMFGFTALTVHASSWARYEPGARP